MELLIASVFCITLFLFAPSMIYISNISEFWFTPNLLYKYIFICTCVGILGITIILLIIKKINKNICSFASVALFFITIAFYIQGNLIPDTNGPLDGTIINWRVVNIDMILSIILWGMVAASIIFILVKRLSEKIMKKLIKPCICIILFELFLSIIVLISVGGFGGNKSKVATNNYEFEYSKNANMIILMLDRLDGEYVKENFTAEDYKILDGFTFYENTMGLFGRTAKALPHVLTGCPYLYDGAYEDYLIASYDNSPLLNRLVEEDWNVSIYTDELIPQDGIIANNIDNFTNGNLGINSRKRFILNIYRLVGYQYSPYPIKKLFWFYADVIREDRKIVDNGNVFSWKNSVFYKNINENEMKVDMDKNVFVFYHLEGMHTSSTTSLCEDSEENVSKADSFKGNTLLIRTFISKLKEKGIYDNSIIIIMGDHGDSADDNGFWGTNPCLLIKGINEKHIINISNKPVSYEDLQDIYGNLLNGQNSIDALKFVSEDERLRHFYRIDPFEWDAILIEYEGTCNASQYEKMMETGQRFYADKALR